MYLYNKQGYFVTITSIIIYK